MSFDNLINRKKQIVISNFQQQKAMDATEISGSQKDNQQISNCNPFGEETQNNQFLGHVDEPQYPLSLDAKNCESQNTPLSRLSEATHMSQAKAFHQSYKSWNGNSNIQKTILAMKPKNNQSVEELKGQVKHLNQMLADIKCYCNVLEKRNEQIAVGLQKQKLKSSHLEHAVNLLRKGEQQHDKKIYEQSESIVHLRQELQSERNTNEGLVQKLQTSIAQNNYLKELILIANSNYETLQKKYLTAVQRNKKMEQQNITKQKQLTYNMHQMKNLLTNLINTPNMPNVLTHNLSFGDQDENCMRKSPNSGGIKGPKKQADQIYRKMFIKTLKGKK